jgi:hypothetical protein
MKQFLHRVQRMDTSSFNSVKMSYKCGHHRTLRYCRSVVELTSNYRIQYPLICRIVSEIWELGLQNLVSLDTFHGDVFRRLP